MMNAGQVLSREQLLDKVWGFDFDPGSNVVDVYIGYLRKKFGAKTHRHRARDGLPLQQLTSFARVCASVALWTSAPAPRSTRSRASSRTSAGSARCWWPVPWPPATTSPA